jgi:hypothetical protein
VELDLGVAAEDRAPDDHGLHGAVGRLVEELEVVRPDEVVAERLGVSHEGHHELARRLVVQLAWAAHLLETVAVSVWPCSLPETTATAPYSPRQRAVVRITP